MGQDIHIHQATFEAQLQNLSPILNWIHDQIASALFQDKEARKVELALEEAVVNIIHYAYKDAKGSLEIICRITPKKRIEFILKDRGQSFNPLQMNSEIDLTSSLEQRKVGGLGIVFIREYMDEVSYERHHPYNILTLVKDA